MAGTTVVGAAAKQRCSLRAGLCPAPLLGCVEPATPSRRGPAASGADSDLPEALESGESARARLSPGLVLAVSAWARQARPEGLEAYGDVAGGW